MSLRFTSSSNYLSNSSLIPATSAGSLAFWLRPLFNSGDGTWVGFAGIQVGGDIFTIERYSDNNIYAGWVVGGNNHWITVSDAGIFAAGTWVHLCYTYTNGGGAALYVNGVSVGTTTGIVTESLAGKTYVIGISGQTANSDIVDHALWNVVISGTSISALAAGARGSTVPTGLISYEPILGNTAPEPDFSGGGFHFTVAGSPTLQSDPGSLTALKTVFYTSTGNVTLPSDLTAANIVYGIGESGNAAGGTTLVTGGGAGAGASAWLSPYTANGASASVPITIGTGGTSVKTIFDTVNNSLKADFGTSASGATAGTGGLTANSVGTQLYAGGNGGAGATLAGGSGGGAAGPIGAGGNAAASSTSTSGNGGTANGGSQAGGVGVGGTAPGNPGIAQSPAPWTATAGGTAAPSSGASGAGGLTLAAESGGAAVAYGGAPGGGDIVSSGTSTGGAPSAGIIVLTYVPGAGGGFTAKQRRTLSPVGTRVGSRQLRAA